MNPRTVLVLPTSKDQWGVSPAFCKFLMGEGWIFLTYGIPKYSETSVATGALCPWTGPLEVSIICPIFHPEFGAANTGPQKIEVNKGKVIFMAGGRKVPKCKTEF